jgi:hypothetical protein
MFILLDIDGVMVPAKSWKAPACMDDGFPTFSTPSVQSLNGILESTNASIVIISSHKDRFTQHQWCAIFEARGIKADILICDIKHRAGRSRKELIELWKSRHNEVSHFIILDDDTSLNDLEKDLKENHLILTSPYIGLNETLVNTAIEKLIQGS